MHSNHLTQILTKAFWNDPMFTELFKGAKKEQHMTKLFQFLIKRNQLMGGELITDGVNYVALLDLNHKMPLMNKVVLLAEMLKLSFFLPFKSLRLLSAYQNITQEHVPQENHYYLTLLGVLPSSQGKGWGGKILNIIHEKIPSSVPIALDTENEKNVAYYEKFGYQLNHVASYGELKIYCMSRRS